MTEPAGQLMQYARSTDPVVLTVVAENQQGLERAAAAAQAWAASKGSTEGFYGNFFLGEFTVTGLPLAAKPRGWANAHKGYRPRARSAEDAEMKALTWRAPRVPGLPEYFEGPASPRDFHVVFYAARPFLSGGAAWVMLKEMPVRGGFGPQWVEVKASEAHAAREAVEGGADRG